MRFSLKTAALAYFPVPRLNPHAIALQLASLTVKNRLPELRVLLFASEELDLL